MGKLEDITNRRKSNWGSFKKRFGRGNTSREVEQASEVVPEANDENEENGVELSPSSPPVSQTAIQDTKGNSVPSVMNVVPLSQLATYNFMNSCCHNSVYNYYYKYVVWHQTSKLVASFIVETNLDLDQFLSSTNTGKFILCPIGRQPTKLHCQQVKLKVHQNQLQLLNLLVSALLTHNILVEGQYIGFNSLSINFLPNYAIFSILLPDTLLVLIIVQYLYEICQWFEPRCTDIINSAVIINSSKCLSVLHRTEKK